MERVTEEKLLKYLELTKKALAKVKIATPEKTELNRTASHFLDMAERYYKDALHFKEKGDFVNSFACVNYAHGWLDAGASMGLFDVGRDSRLFTVE